MDDTSVNFIELVALSRITADSTAERFGSLINSSFFDASNILATLKQKGLVDFVTAFPTQSTLKVTDGGNELLARARKKSTEPLDALDMAIMMQLSVGRRSLVDLNGSVNVTQKDLALHLFKLEAQQQVSFELANANMNIYLTEKGFLAVRTSGQPMPQAPTFAAQEQTKPVPEATGAPGGPAPGAPAYDTQPKPGDEMKVIEELIRKNKARRKRRLVMMVLLAVILVAFVVVLHIKGVI